MTREDRADLWRRLDTIDATLARVLAAVERRGGCDAAAGRLVAEIATAVGNRRFTTAELFRHANRAAPRLREALGAALTDRPKQLGKYLRRIQGHEFEGLIVERVGDSRDGLVWSVRVCGFEGQKLAGR